MYTAVSDQFLNHFCTMKQNGRIQAVISTLYNCLISPPFANTSSLLTLLMLTPHTFSDSVLTQPSQPLLGTHSC